MDREIRIGDLVKDVCGDVGEVVDVEYDCEGKPWRYILMHYDGSSDERYQWPAHSDYATNLNC